MDTVHQIKTCVGQGQDWASAAEGADTRANEWLQDNRNIVVEVESITHSFPPDGRVVLALIHYKCNAEDVED